MPRLIPDDLWGYLTVWGEARNQPFEGKIAVAEVILERTRRHYASAGTVASTVLWAQQFSCWNQKDPNRIQMALADVDDPALQACRQAWWTAVAPNHTPVVPKAVLYLNPAVSTPLWITAATVTRIRRIQDHVFYRLAEPATAPA